MRNFDSQVVMITGASRGIGQAAAKAFASKGAKVACIARTDQALEDTISAIDATGGIAQSFACDVSDPNSVLETASHIEGKMGKISILVNNAGTIEPIARIDEISPQDWSKVVDINLKGPFYCIQAVLPQMQALGHGCIINMSSGAATSALEGWSHYCATKAGLYSLTRCTHKEFAEKGIRVVGLSPGTVATDMIASIHDSGVNPVSQLDRSVHISPDDAAKAIVWLATDKARQFDGGDFSLKTSEGRKLVGLD